MMSVTCYLILAIYYLLSDTCYLKLAPSCKNLIPFAPVVRLALVYFEPSQKGNTKVEIVDKFVTQ